MIIAVSCFSKHSIVDIWQGSEYASGSEYLRVLNMSLVLNVLEFWIYQGSKYASGFKYARILNTSEYWICQCYTGFRMCLNISWLCLIMSECAWLCRKMLEYAEICVNMPKSAWMAFVLQFPCGYIITWWLICRSTGD